MSSQCYQIYSERPSKDGRSEKENAVYDLLAQLQIPFIRVEHEATPTIESCQEIDQALELEICKNLFLCNAQKTDFYLLLMPGGKKFKTKDLSGQLKVSRLSFAGEEYLKEYLNLMPGSVSILGLMNDHTHRVRLVIDREIAEAEYLGCHPCVNTGSLKIATREVLEKFLNYTGHDYTLVEL